MSLPTPPRYVVLPQEIIEQAYAPDKPRRALLSSFIRILSLAWESKYQHTPSLNEEELMEFLKLSRRQYFEQKADMELLQWLRSSHPRPGFVQFSFSRLFSEKGTAQEASAENRTRSAENRTAELKRMEEEELIQVKDSESSSSLTQAEVRKTALTTHTPSGKKMQLLVENLHLLFKPEDHGMLEWREIFLVGIPDRVLGWIAKAYQDRKRLDAPLGLIAKHIVEQDPPKPYYLDNAAQILPEDYLEAIGEVELACGYCADRSATFTCRTDLNEHIATYHPHRCQECNQDFPDEAQRLAHYQQVHEGSEEADPFEGIDIDDVAVRAWQAALGQLQMEMPRATFDTWVRDTKAVRYDGNTMHIAVRNAYARDWLESRLRSTVSRLLVGILNKSVDVLFVTVGQVLEEE